MDVDPRVRALRAVVDGLEAELRRMQLWEREPPSEQLLTSAQPFCFDTLLLSQWLQWRLIPQVRQALAGEVRLPTRSAIYPLAKDSFEHLEDPGRLLMWIARFDQLIRDEAAAVVH